MGDLVKCGHCCFEAHANKKENARAIAAIHITDCTGDPDMDDIFIGSGLHKFGHLGWVSLEWATKQVRHIKQRHSDNELSAYEALKEVDNAFSFPDDDLKHTEDWIADSLMQDMLEVAKRHG